MRKFLDGLFCIIVGMVFTTTMMLCILTPEKTDKGEYTQPIRYWVDSEYFNNNFRH